ncbi:MAG: YgjV family protein [Cytophagaceae bacterium]|nr:YgjV family protein [Gemmatimonadaceae bacterium]
MNVTWIGWAATVVFTASYFARRQQVLRRVQMAGALLWLGYGIAIEAPPVVVANVLVLAAAVWTTWRHRDKSLASP